MKETKKVASDSPDKKGFRLLGILTGNRPSEEEIKLGKKDYFKVLKENTYYPFYSCFSYKNDNGVQTLTYHPEKDIDLYSTDSDTQTGQKHPSIHISAIVGKNGTGKSTLLELLYLAAYHIGVAGRVLKDPESEQSISWIKTELGVDLELFFLENSKTITHLRFYNRHIENKYILDPRIRSYELSGNTHIIQLDQTHNSETFHQIERTLLKNLFYSVAINYSIYGLNAKSIGTWINHLFHKNDAYQTPLVINPMRTEGDFKINLEKDLAISRLLVNMVENNLQTPLNKKSDDKYWITDKQYVWKLKLKMSSSKSKIVHFNGIEPKPYDEIYKDYENKYKTRGEFLDYIFDKLVGVSRVEVQKKNIPGLEYIENYLVRKLLKLTHSYPKQFEKFYRTNHIAKHTLSGLYTVRTINTIINENDFLDYILKENTHITLKVRQIINYLKNPYLLNDQDIQWDEKKKSEIVDGEERSYSEFKLTLDLREFAKRLEAIDRKGFPFIDFIPPALFQPDLVLGPSENDDTILFSQLSSGEQQQIHSVQSILYHLRNIHSVHEKDKNSEIKNEDDQRISFKNVNLILDEIELYAHPEMQRKFIDDLIKGIRRLKLVKIEGINILLATHSPFILSDIPAQNILRLKLNNEGKAEPEPMKEQTFGANIHDLLANEFFLENGFMGEFAKERIKETIEWLTNKKRKMKLKSWHKAVIELIGEPILKRKLLEMYDEVCGENSELNYLRKRVEELEKKQKENVSAK